MGENGWHPHNHILLFTQHAVHGFASYRDQLARIWMDSCIKAGLRLSKHETWFRYSGRLTS